MKIQVNTLFHIATNKALQSEQNTLSCLLLAQKPRQHVLSAEERRSVPEGTWVK
jgi:hypothetical protein